MRKVKLEVQLSIDGFMATLEGKTDWMVWNWGPVWGWDESLQNYHTELTRTSDCVLVSRNMAEEGFINHWADVAKRSNDPQAEFARHITGMRKLVFSTTLNENEPNNRGWNNTTLIGSDFVKSIHELKREKGKDIIVYGGASFVSSLINADLIDEYHFVVNPVALGKGLSIFDDVAHPLKLKLARANASKCGVTWMVYTR